MNQHFVNLYLYVFHRRILEEHHNSWLQKYEGQTVIICIYKAITNNDLFFLENNFLCAFTCTCKFQSVIECNNNIYTLTKTEFVLWNLV